MSKPIKVNFNQSDQLELENRKKSRVDLDTILVEEIGQFGRYQFRVLVLAAVVAIFSGFTSEFVFSTARIKTRCFIPECELDNHNPEYASTWILNAVPGASLDNFDNCQRYANASLVAASSDDSCPAALFDHNSVTQCERYVYENTNTIVYDFDLACNEWRRALIGSIRTLGSVVGLPITGYVSDKWGRCTALVLTSINAAWIGVSRALVSDYYSFAFLHFLESALAASFICVHILSMELVGPKFRTISVASTNTFYSFGQMLLGFIAWRVKDWRYLLLTLYIPQFLTISYYWIMSESVRWYMSKGRYKESENILKKVARINRRTISEESLLALKLTSEEDKKLSRDKEKLEESWLTLLFRYKTMMLRCFVTGTWWMTGTMVYLGLSINVVNISGNRYLNYAAVSAIEIPGCWFSVYLMNKVGRKPLFIFSWWVCATCQIGYILTPKDMFGLMLALFFISKFIISMVMNTMYVYAGELYPTLYRHRFFAASSMMGRVGTFIAPLTPAFGEHIPFALFAAFATLAGALTFITPETVGTKLPDTMEEAANIGKNKAAT